MTVTLVCGPPCSGKSWWTGRHAGPGAMVVDHDVLARQAGSTRVHSHLRVYRDAAERAVEGYLRAAQVGALPGEVWIERTVPAVAGREALARRVRAVAVVVLVPPREVLYQRAAARENPRYTRDIIDWWLRTYQPAGCDTLTVTT